MKLSSILNGILNGPMIVLLPEDTQEGVKLIPYQVWVGEGRRDDWDESEMKLLIRNVSLLMIKDSFETIMNLKKE